MSCINVTRIVPNLGLVQLGKLLVLLKVFTEYQSEPISIFSESQYTVQVVHVLSFSHIKESINPLYVTMRSLQDALEQRAHPGMRPIFGLTPNFPVSLPEARN